MKKILIVDDDVIIRIALSKILKQDNWQLKLTGRGRTTISALDTFNPNLVLLDFNLPDINGFEILKYIKKNHREITVIMITSFADVPKAVKAMKLGAFDFIPKPFTKREILSVVKKALKEFKDNDNITDLARKMGKSKPLMNVLEKINRIADKDISVFLEGETGTGKELFAKMIHQKSKRKNKPFIAVDCGAIPENLFESELFGHKKGAFTGATSDKKGKFELADGGTIFLDEINSLPMNMQPKFLRVLQESEIQRLGEEYPKKIDIRIIAASNNNINEDVRTGIFRQDLFYRIHEFKINLPPLRERKDDILTIAEYFLDEINADYQKEIKGFSEKAKRALLSYSWPGNIRELKNVIKTAVILCDGNIIEEDNLIFINLENHDSQNKDFVNLSEHSSEKDRVISALKRTKYNKTEAAKLLGVSRSKFYKLLEKFGL